MRHRTTLIILSGLFLGFLGAVSFSPKEKSRRPSSLAATKNNWLPPTIEKHLALLKVEIVNPLDIPESGSDKDVTLVGRILVNQRIQGNLSFTWTLPEDIQVVDGQLSDSISNIQQGQVAEVKLTITGFNKEKQRLISLQAFGKVGGSEEILGGSAVISSRPEDTWEAVASDMKKSAEEQLRSSPSPTSE